MARVKVCPSCRNENAASQPFCANCDFALADVDITVVEIMAAEASAAPTISETVEPKSAVGTWREEVPAERSGVRATLLFPWGEVRVVDTLLVGRENSPLADHLEALNYVSRAHAEIYVDEGKLYVRDLHSRNFTYVNGERIGTQPVALTEGDELAFSRHLVARVRLS
jgi:hypothetical protein